jgi:uncharacterized repeat protein (TIGR01451 family)
MKPLTGLRRALPLFASVAALVAMPAAAAQASYTIGQTSGATDNCGSDSVYVQASTASTGSSYAASSDGVIVSWSYLAHTFTPDIKLKVYHSTSDPAKWFLRSESALRTGGTTAGHVRANQLNTFAESPGIPIKTGDALGLTVSGSSSSACITGQTASDVTRVKAPPDAVVGQDNSGFNGALSTQKIGVQAVVEPDADGDGFGDESQDSCTTDASVHTGPCPVDVSIVKTVGPNPTVGSDLTFTLAVKNNGATNPATGVSVLDPLPSTVTFVSSAAGQGSCTGTSTVSCAIGTLAPGQSTTVTIVVRPTAPGALSNTASVTTTAQDTDTSNNSSTASATVAPPPPPPAPVLSILTLDPASFRAAKSGPSVRAAATTGTVLSYTNSQASITTFTVFKRAPGVRKGKRCVAPPRKKPSKKPKRCTRFLKRGTFTHFDTAGAVRFRFTGRVNGKTLAPGRYRLRAVASNATGPSKPRQRDFTIKK